jgi:N-acetylglucosaminyldiphosphoundecaprenol N-acetyl-beta-D-mannosaminyltransferase
MPSVKLFDLTIDTRTPNQLIDDIIIHVTKKNSPERIVQINPEMVVDLYKNPHARSLFNSVDITVANGVGLQWAATYAKTQKRFIDLIKTLSWIIFKPSKIQSSIPARYTSSSFTAPLLKQLGTHNARILIAGSPKGSTIETTAAHLQDMASGLEVSSFDTADFDTHKLNGLCQRIQHHEPDVVLLAIGYPLQENAAQKVQSIMKHGVVVTEGGTFDYQQFGGNIARAPGLLQKIGLEWLWRLAREPWRIRRQAALLKFIWLTYRNI